MFPILVLAILSLCCQGNTQRQNVMTTVTVWPIGFLIGSTDASPGPPVEIEPSGTFIDPENIEDGVDSFKYFDKEYLLIKTKMRFKYSNVLCKKYNAQLATIKSFVLGNFLAEALSETNLLLDSLWIWGTREEGEKWMWKASTNESDSVDSNIIAAFVYHEKIGGNKSCLSFARSDHDKPQFRPLDCAGSRSLICERPYTPEFGNGNSTHDGLITVGNRQYKIFREHVDYTTARMKCGDFQPGFDLAVITDSETVQILSRYLLIGRPSLENAWIQAKYMNSHFMYPTEPDVVLSNKTDDSTGFPPWRDGVIQKPSGCVLLDRHLKNIGLFVEARCHRLRPYICYSMAVNDSDVRKEDTIIDNHGYRLIYNQLPWLEACNFCKNEYQDYGAKLAEPQTLDLVNDLTVFMGEYRLAVLHIWIGGKMESLQWIWDSSGTAIEATILSKYGITNTTFSEHAESMNVCLNFDRENHNVPLIYGTMCSYPQSFVCMFDKDKFLELLEHEKGSHGNSSKPPNVVSTTPTPQVASTTPTPQVVSTTLPAKT